MLYLTTKIGCSMTILHSVGASTFITNTMPYKIIQSIFDDLRQLANEKINIAMFMTSYKTAILNL